MKTLLLATVLSAAFAPAAFASQDGCPAEERRRAEQPASSRETRIATQTECEARAGEAERTEAARRRSGKRIPDAELIGTRAVL